jgi:broad specificity phosphatase PhoE
VRLLLISHAAASAGQDLSEAARGRAAEVGRALPSARAAFTSAAPVAVQTAEALGLHSCPDLALGDWPEHDEPIAELFGRVGEWLRLRRDEQGTRAAVTHVAVIRAAVVLALEIPARRFDAIDVAPCSVTVLSYRESHWRVDRLNWEPALLHIPQRRGRRRHKPTV